MRIISDTALAVVVLWQEAQGESDDGMTAVGEGIRNRMRLHYNSDGTLPGTVVARFQFSAFNDDALDNQLLIRSLKINDDDPIVQRCQQAWIHSEFSSLTDGAVLYYNPKTSKPRWDFTKLIKTVEIGNHWFYKLAP